MGNTISIKKCKKKNVHFFYSRRFAMPQSGQFLHYRSNSLYYNEKVRTKEKFVNRYNLQVQIFQAKKKSCRYLYSLESYYSSKIHKKTQVARFVGVFTIYVCAYYFLTNKDI